MNRLSASRELEFQGFECGDCYAILDVNNVIAFRVEKDVGPVLHFLGKAKFSSEAVSMARMKYGVKTVNLALSLVEHYQDSIGDITAEEESEHPTTVTSLFLDVTHGCNLRCKYCYAEAGSYGSTYRPSEQMPPATARAAIDYLWDSASDDRLTVNFFGGEPLLNTDIIAETVEYGRAKQGNGNRKISFGVTTNATLVSDDFIRLVKDSGLGVLVSLDGSEEAHNSTRRYPSGEGSYRDTLNGARLLLETVPGNTRVRATLSRLHSNMYETAAHLFGLGFSCVSIGFVSDPPEYTLTAEQWKDLRRDYREIITMVVRQMRDSGVLLNFLELTEDIARLYAGRKVYHCGSGRWLRAIDARGDVYPCQRFVGLPDYRLGNVFHGENNTEVKKRFSSLTVHNNRFCSSCWARYLCGGGCPHVNLRLNGQLDEPDRTTCSWFKYALSESIRVMAELQDSGQSDIIRRIYEESGGLKSSDVNA